MRLVLDTNVLISTLIARGICTDLLEHCVLSHTIVASDFIFNELRDHLLMLIFPMGVIANDYFHILLTKQKS